MKPLLLRHYTATTCSGSGKQALLLGLAQRNMSTPIPNQAPGPNVPLSPDAPMPQAAPAMTPTISTPPKTW